MLNLLRFRRSYFSGIVSVGNTAFKVQNMVGANSALCCLDDSSMENAVLCHCTSTVWRSRLKLRLKFRLGTLREPSVVSTSWLSLVGWISPCASIALQMCQM